MQYPLLPSTPKGLKSLCYIFLLWMVSTPAWAGLGTIQQEINITDITAGATRTTIWRPGTTGVWDDFGLLSLSSLSLAPGEVLQIQQASPASTTILRVTGNSPTVLQGRIESNGRVILIHDRGVTLSPGSVVSVASLLVSGLDFGAADLAQLESGALLSVHQTTGGEVKALGRVEITGGVGKSGQVNGDLILVGRQVSLAGSVDQYKRGGHLLAVAANQVRLTLSGQPSAQILLASDFFAPNLDPLLSVTAAFGPHGVDRERIQLSARAQAAGGMGRKNLGGDVLFLAAHLTARRSIIVDGGGYGDTHVADASLTLVGSGHLASTIDVLGGHVEVFRTILRLPRRHPVPGQVRIGGDEEDPGNDRHASTHGTRLAYSTHIGPEVTFLAAPSDRVHITGYSVLRESDPRLLLVSGLNGVLRTPWLNDPEEDAQWQADQQEHAFAQPIVSLAGPQDLAQMAAGLASHLENPANRGPGLLQVRVNPRQIFGQQSGTKTVVTSLTRDTDRVLYTVTPPAQVLEQQLAAYGFYQLLDAARQSLDWQRASALITYFPGLADAGFQERVHRRYHVTRSNGTAPDPETEDVPTIHHLALSPSERADWHTAWSLCSGPDAAFQPLGKASAPHFSVRGSMRNDFSINLVAALRRFTDQLH